MPQSNKTRESGKHAVSIGLAGVLLAAAVMAGCSAGRQPEAPAIAPAARPPAPLAQASATAPEQEAQASGPAVTLPAPAPRSKGELAPAATIAAPSADEIARGPRLAVVSTYFDFGQVKPAQVLTHTFAFTNTGQSELIIQHINST